MNSNENNTLLKNFINEGFLISPDLIDNKLLTKENIRLIKEKIKTKDKPLVLTEDIINLVQNSEKILLNWLDFESFRADFEKNKNQEAYNQFLNKIINTTRDKLLSSEEVKEQSDLRLNNKNSSVIILKPYPDKPKKRDVQDFVSYYSKRYENLRKLLMGRQELQKATSINRIINKNKEEVYILGLISDKTTTKNGNIILTIEDLTGSVNVLINKNKKEIYDNAKLTVPDEIVGITGLIKNKIIFVNNLLFPDIPLKRELKKSKELVYAAFTSDLHIGNKMFLEKEFLRFINWLNGEIGDGSQKEIAKNVKYLFIVGDVIDGVGIYPEQDEELEIKDVVQQYQKCAELLKKIRSDINIIICGGQHDALRLAEPQPPLDPNFAKPVYELKNVYLVNNPSLININSSDNFEGFDILMYHGASFHYYIDNVEYLRSNNARDNPHLVLKFLLQKRHLAPTHESSLFIPDINEDFRIITKIPDIFVAGEMHRSDNYLYNNVTLINCSCWQAKTKYQERIGSNPDPCKVPIVNLKTREIKIMKFGE